MQQEYDCIVIGAGPAGGTAAALVAEGGNRTLLVEREKMPRFHVGESLMPEVYWTLKRLGVLEKVQAKGAFTTKNGVQFVTDRGKESRPFFFQEHDHRECALTWHVKRSDFDQILFENAAEKGADCVDQARVTRIDFCGPSLNQVEVQLADGSTNTVSAKVIVDASGQQSLIANKLALKEVDPKLKKAAIWGYFKNGKRNSEEGAPEVTCILHTRDKKAWYWYIPLSDGTISVGLVSNNEFILKGRGKPHDTFFEEMENCEGVQRRLEGATLEGEVRVAKEFSYKTKKHAGEGWVLVGDAYSFIDPVYSSGVFLALRSGEFAADAINQGLQTGDLSAAQLGCWTEDYDQGVKLFRKLVDAFYTDEFSFGEFMKQYPHYKKNLTDLLIGRVYGDEDPGEIFREMEPWIEHSKAGTLDDYVATLSPPSTMMESL
ncbi:MAG: tryptophan 7-halogenase [Planctomycetota bacterium]|nr:tryptophan 7-halogenase [Planctomycetota bacterium]